MVVGLMDKNYSKTIEEIVENRPARVFIKTALKDIFIISSRWDFLTLLLICLVSGIVSYKVAFARETVEFMLKMCGHLLEIQLALFSCIFAVYSILLAFLSDEYMKRLAKISANGKVSSLTQYTTYYESILFLYFINISVTALLLFACLLSSDVSLTSNLEKDNAIAFIGLFIYFSFSFRVFYEIKSTIYNTVILFRYSIAYRFLAFAKEDEENEKSSQKKVDEVKD